MKKLKLEDLQVTSFETSAAGARDRGTIDGHAAPGSRNCPPNTYGGCPDTEYFDCTLGCSRATDCPNTCVA